MFKKKGHRLGKKERRRITVKEFSLAFIFAVMGFLLSMKVWIQFLDGLNVFLGFLVYYLILYGVLLALSHFDLVIFGIHIKNPMQTLGLLLITFSLFVIIDWESPYVNISANGSADGVSSVYFQSEDGITWSFWDLVFDNVQALRFMTYVFTPFVLTLLGGYLVTKPKIGGM